ncbi:ROK family protein [Clostridium felsineum]|uniref:ROK family protein n=1 Tax=Clostridium felsineum TaxID=36839 RepID=UPI00214DB391|nr:ROK family protein [Clostridium felsineum]MCR3760883.1 ROK family protein [Clostridium felsineum]
MNLLAFDVGGTSVKYAIVDNNGEILEKGKFKTPKEDIEELINKLKEVKGGYGGKYYIEGIAMSMPGSVNSETGVIGGYSAVPCIHGFNIKKKISEALNLPVTIENDANCAALGEVWKGAAKGLRDVLFIICGSGIGGAVVKDKKIHKGANLHGGEFGYMIFSKSCETLSKAASTVEVAKKIAKEKGIPLDEFNGEKAFKLMENGDEVAKKHIEEMYYNIAAAIYNLQYAYDAEMVVIGGAISEREDFIDNIDKNVDDILKKVEIAKIKPTVKKCEFGNDANIIGAVYNFLNS